MKKIILVLGMHRSGTSLLSRSMAIFGAQHGENLFTSLIGNPKGHWEDNDILNFDEEILHHFNQKWDNPTPLTSENINTLHIEGYFDRATSLVKEKLEKNSLWTLKEPRITKLLPFWNQVFESLELDVKYVFAFRHPYSVAQSLKKRNKYNLDFGLYFWYSYNIFALYELKGKNVFFVNYDDFLDNTENYFSQLELFLEETINAENKDFFLNNFIDSSLRTFPSSDAQDVSPKIYDELFQQLKSYVNKSVKLSEEFDSYVSNFYNTAYECLQQQVQKTTALQTDISQKEQTIAELQRNQTQNITDFKQIFNEKFLLLEQKINQQLKNNSSEIITKISNTHIHTNAKVTFFQSLKNIILQPLLKKKAFHLCNTGQIYEAEGIALSFILNNPYISWSYYILGKINAQQGKKELAIANLQKAIDIDPYITYYRTYLSSIMR